ncbi:acyl-CoA dehydrogenase [Rhodococcus sp. 2H158]
MTALTTYAEELATIATSVGQILREAPDTAAGWKLLADNGFASLAADDSLDLPVPALVAAVSEQTGRTLSSVPWLAGSVVATAVATRLESEIRDELVAALDAGQVTVLAVPVSTSAWDVSRAGVAATRDGDRWELTGSVTDVLNGADAARVLVPTDQGLFLLETDGSGVVVTPGDTADPSRPLADLDFRSAAARHVAAPDTARAAVQYGLTAGLVALTAELIGAAEEMLEQTIAYIKERRAFGRVVGQFQGVKHTTVDLWTEVTHARALLRNAIAALGDGSATSEATLVPATLAKVQASKALSQIATRGILLHGAIGFTWELGAHRFVRRATTDRFLFGDDDELVRLLAGHLTTRRSDDTDRAESSPEAGWLAQHAPRFVGPRDHVGHFAVLTPEEAADQLRRARDWERLKSENGFAGIAVPTELGGQGRSRFEALQFQAEEHRYELPHWLFAITYGMILPTVVQWGTDEQKQRYVPRMLNGEHLWCQLFSEPGAGSDLAMASTRATRAEGGWRIDGQKVWNSGADNADLGLLVARTDPNVPKHQGLTVFVVPMDTPGVTVRPIVQNSGSALFCETFFDDVFLPDEAVLGEVGNGWRVAITTLMNERLALTGDGVPFQRMFREAQERAADLTEAQGVQLVELYSIERALHALSAQMFETVRSGNEPGPEGSVNKLLTGRAALGVADFVSRLLGPEVLRDRDWNEYVLGAVGLLIGGGTEEIQKNVLAERVLGLPPEPRDRVKVSWAEEKAANRKEPSGAR